MCIEYLELQQHIHRACQAVTTETSNTAESPTSVVAEVPQNTTRVAYAATPRIPPRVACAATPSITPRVACAATPSIPPRVACAATPSITPRVLFTNTPPRRQPLSSYELIRQRRSGLEGTEEDVRMKSPWENQPQPPKPAQEEKGKWACDYCNEAFATYDQAVEHEERCGTSYNGNQEQNKKRPANKSAASAKKKKSSNILFSSDEEEGSGESSTGDNKYEEDSFLINDETSDSSVSYKPPTGNKKRGYLKRDEDYEDEEDYEEEQEEEEEQQDEEEQDDKEQEDEEEEEHSDNEDEEDDGEWGQVHSEDEEGGGDDDEDVPTKENWASGSNYMKDKGRCDQWWDRPSCVQRDVDGAVVPSQNVQQGRAGNPGRGTASRSRKVKITVRHVSPAKKKAISFRDDYGPADYNTDESEISLEVIPERKDRTRRGRKRGTRGNQTTDANKSARKKAASEKHDRTKSQHQTKKDDKQGKYQATATATVELIGKRNKNPVLQTTLEQCRDFHTLPYDIGDMRHGGDEVENDAHDENNEDECEDNQSNSDNNSSSNDNDDSDVEIVEDED